MPHNENLRQLIGTQDATEHLLRKSSVPNLDKELAQVPQRALESALIEVYVLKARELTPQNVQNQYETNAFTNASELNQREIINFESYILGILPSNIDMIELSPVTAFGSNSVLSKISQKNVLTTSRNTEVVADGVTSLTLEIAKKSRLNKGTRDGYRLGTFHRELRTQMHEQPGFTSHFHALSLVSSSMDNQPDAFKSNTFSEQAETYLQIIDNTNGHGYQAENLTVALSNIRIAELLIKNLGFDRQAIMRHTQTPNFNLFDEFSIPIGKNITPQELPGMAETLPTHLAFLKRPILYMASVFAKLVNDIQNMYGNKVVVYFDLSRHAGVGYYQDLSVKISASNSKKEIYPLVDIGSNDWLAKILSNKNARLITGGMGTELFMKQFKRPTSTDD